MGKRIIAIVAAIAAYVLMVIAADMVSHSMQAPPADLDYKNAEAVKTFLRSLSIGNWLVYTLLHALGAIIAGAVLRLVGKEYNRQHANVLGIVIASLEGFNGFSTGHPIWQPIVAILIAFPCVFIGHMLVKRNG
ncbi:MAG: hypothetical protein RL660_1837 [Bacteroidota bacterium]|jgi:hypothetical protein